MSYQLRAKWLVFNLIQCQRPFFRLKTRPFWQIFKTAFKAVRPQFSVDNSAPGRKMHLVLQIQSSEIEYLVTNKWNLTRKSYLRP